MSAVTAERAEDAVKRIVSIALGVSFADVKTTDRLIDDLGADSLDLLEIVMDVEKEFGVEIDDESAREIRTVRDLMNRAS